KIETENKNVPEIIKQTYLSIPTLFFFFFFFFLRQRSAFCPGWSAVRHLRSLQALPGPRRPAPPGFTPFPAISLRSSGDYRRPPPRPANFCIFLVETGFHHVSQDGLDL
uniref:Uncharacterized protein n=1 Tax=Astyanax mexicanus TaxID=7994 RepID=A0A3B1KBZ9_ASTMX